MLNSTPRKTGRPVAYLKTRNGDRIEGLMRLGDGRWRASGPEKFTFTEPDEDLAILRFRQWQAKKSGAELIRIPVAIETSTQGATNADVNTVFHPRPETHLDDDGKSVTTRAAFPDAIWSWVRQEILTRPQFVAKMTGIEQIGYLTNLIKPTPSPTLKSIGDTYAAKPGMSPNEVSRSKLFWSEFTNDVGVDAVRELNYENIGKYEAKVTSGKYGPKSILHRYRKVRTVFTYAIKRGIGIEDCRRALDITAMLEVKDHTPLDPQPISVEQFHAMFGEALKAGDTIFATMLLTSLNTAMYAGEVAALKWEELDLKKGELVTRRPKTGVSRIAVLWAETAKALRALPRTSDHVFNTRVRSYTVYSAMAAWRKYREAAELPDGLVFSQVRDAAYSIALTVSLDQAKLLAGHRLSGAADHYVRRNPSMVSQACEAIRIAFGPFKQPPKR